MSDYARFNETTPEDDFAEFLFDLADDLAKVEFQFMQDNDFTEVDDE